MEVPSSLDLGTKSCLVSFVRHVFKYTVLEPISEEQQSFVKCSDTYFENHGTLDDAPDRWHCLTNFLKHLDKLCYVSNVAAIYCNSTASFFELAGELLHIWLRLGGSRHQDKILGTSVHHPSGNGSSYTAKSSHNHVRGIRFEERRVRCFEYLENISVSASTDGLKGSHHDCVSRIWLNDHFPLMLSSLHETESTIYLGDCVDSDRLHSLNGVLAQQLHDMPQNAGNDPMPASE